MYRYPQKYDNLTYLDSFYCIFLQNSLMQSVLLLARRALSEHKCTDYGPYLNSMIKCSANRGYYASQEKEAFGSGEGIKCVSNTTASKLNTPISDESNATSITTNAIPWQWIESFLSWPEADQGVSPTTKN